MKAGTGDWETGEKGTSLRSISVAHYLLKNRASWRP